MGVGRVVGDPALMAGVGPGHLLQEHHIGADGANRFAQLMQDELAVEEGEPFVDVDRQHLDRKTQRRCSNDSLGDLQRIGFFEGRRCNGRTLH